MAAPTPRPRRAWFILFLLLGVFLATGWLVMQRRLDSGRGLPDYSVYSEGRNGLAKAAWLLQQLGWQNVALTRPIQQTLARGLLIIVEPEEQLGMLGFPYYLSDAETKGLLNWAADGNTILFCGRHTTRRRHTARGNTSSHGDASRRDDSAGSWEPPGRCQSCLAACRHTSCRRSAPGCGYASDRRRTPRCRYDWWSCCCRGSNTRVAGQRHS